MSDKKPAQRPWGMRLTGWLLIAIPIFNVISLRVYFGVWPDSFASAMKIWTPFGFGLMVAAPFVGIAVLRLRKVAWYAFLTFAAAIILQNATNLFSSSNAYNAAGLVQSLVAFGLLAYFLRKDVYKPLLAQEERGWRRSKRYDVALEVAAQDAVFTTTNASMTGLFLTWQDSPLKAGDRIKLTIGMEHDTPVVCEATVRNRRDDGVGVEFDHLTPEQKAKLAPMIKHSVRENARYKFDSVTIAGQTMKVRDISLTGLYLHWPNCPLEKGAGNKVQIPLESGSIECAVEIVRVDQNGAGLEFVNLSDMDRHKLEHQLSKQPKVSETAVVHKKAS